MHVDPALFEAPAWRKRSCCVDAIRGLRIVEHFDLIGRSCRSQVHAISRTVQLLPSSVAVLTQTRSHTTGDDQALPGIGVFQRTCFGLAPLNRQVASADVAIASRATKLGPVVGGGRQRRGQRSKVQCISATPTDAEIVELQ